MKKAFNELTEKGKQARLAKYEKERQERGTSKMFAQVWATKIVDVENGNGAHRALVLLSEISDGKRKQVWASAYIKPEKVGTSYENYYANIKKGQLVDVEFRMNNGFMNIYNMFNRESKKSK